METDPVGTAQIAYWNDQAAAHWVALQNRLDQIFAPLTVLAIQEASPRPGARAGCGSPR
jgi:hypothetical protein